MFPTIWRNQKPGARAQQFPLLTLFDEMNRLFEDSAPALGSTRLLSNFTPTIDVKETPAQYVVSGEFPGLDAKDIHIEVRDNSITMSGEKRHEHDLKDGDRVYRERTYGAFTRTIPFELEVDEDAATAEMKNGVLSITVPKSSKAVKGAKKISIKSA